MRQPVNLGPDVVFVDYLPLLRPTMTVRVHRWDVVTVGIPYWPRWSRSLSIAVKLSGERAFRLNVVRQGDWYLYTGKGERVNTAVLDGLAFQCGPMAVRAWLPDHLYSAL